MKYVSSCFLLFFASLAFAASEAPQTFTLDGRLYSDTAGTTPLTDTDVDLVFQILDDSQTCILYEETRSNFNASTTNGYFTFQIGSATGDTKRSANDPGFTMKQIYSNVPQAGLNGKLLSNPASNCAHNPSSRDQRFVRIQVTPSDNVTRTLSPFMAIDSVPNAIVAEHAETAAKIGAFGPSDLLRVNTTAPQVLSQVNLENIFTTSNYAVLTALLAGTSNLYNKPASNGTNVLPTIASPSSPAAGQIWYNAGNVYFHDGSVTKTISTGSSTGVSATDGTAAAPSMSFASDPDTGWYLAAANNLAAATGGAERVRINENGNLGIGSSNPGARLTLGGDMSATAWVAGGIGIRQNSANYTDTTSSGTVGFNYINAFGVPTLIASSATTYTNASTFSIYPPVPGSNVTLTNSTALTINSQNLTGGGGVTRGYGMQVNAPTGAANNYAATFMGGNVGVGTTAPVDTLQVESSTTTVLGVNTTGSGATDRAMIGFDRAGAQQWDVGVNSNNGNTNNFYIRRTPGLNYVMTFAENGNVGVGTTAPTAALHLKAGTTAAGTAPLKFTVGTNLTTPEDGAMEYSGTSLYFTVGATRYSIPLGSAGSFTDVSSISNSAGNITMSPVASSGSVVIDSGTTSINSTSGALRVSGGVGVTGDINAGASISAGTTLSAGTNAFIPQIYGGAGSGDDIRIDGTSHATKGDVLLATAGAGRVGIGTTAPAVRLESQVTGNGLPLSSGSAQTYGALRLSQTSGNVILDMGVSNANGPWIQATQANNLATNQPLLLNPNGGNVGIGTTAANLGGTSSSAGRTYVNISGTNAAGILQLSTTQADGNNNQGAIEWVDLATANADKRIGYINVYKNSATANNRGTFMAFATKLDNGTGASERMRVTEAGDLCVGCTSAGGRVDIKGSTADSTANGLLVRDSAGTGLLTVRNDGKVGIGTTAPSEKLDVKGNIAISGSTSGAVKFAVPAVAGSATYTWPAAAPASNMVLQSDNTGTLSWVAAATGSGDVKSDGSVAMTGTLTSSAYVNYSGTFTGADSNSAGVSLATYGTNGAFINGNHNTSAFAGDFLRATMASASGSFTGKFINFQKNNVAQMTVDASGNAYFAGNVGVGTSTPGSKLDVKGDIAISGSTSGAVKFAVPAVAGSATYTWPAAAPASNMVLQSDNTGTLSWVAPGGSGDFKADGTVPMTGAFRSIGGTNSAPGMTFVGDTDTGFYSGSADTINIAAGGTALGFFSSTSLTLTDYAAVTQITKSSINVSAGTSAGSVTLFNGGAANSGTVLGILNFRGSAGSGSGVVQGVATETHTIGAKGTAIAFQTTANGGTTTNEKMRIDHNGNVGIGATAPAEKLDVNGNVIATAYLYTSDKRLKKDIEPLDEALQKILSLSAVSYHWTDVKKDGDREQIGLIAQEVREVYPQAVREDSQGWLRVDYPSLIAPIVKAVQELYAQLTGVKTQVETLQVQTAEQDRALASEVEQLRKENKEMKERLEKIEKMLNSK